MADWHDEEMAIAIVEGIVSRSDAAIVDKEARRRRVSSRALLVDLGRLSPDSLRSLLAVRIDSALSGSTLSISSTGLGRARSAAGERSPAFPVSGWSLYTGPRFLAQAALRGRDQSS